MKSVVDVAFSGSWFCSSLSSRPRKSLDEIVDDELDEELVDDVCDAFDVLDVEDVVETVMARSGFSRRASRDETPLVRLSFVKVVREMKRAGGPIQARIICTEAFDYSAEFAACGARQAIA